MKFYLLCMLAQPIGVPYGYLEMSHLLFLLTSAVIKLISVPIWSSRFFIVCLSSANSFAGCVMFVVWGCGIFVWGCSMCPLV